MTVVKDVVCPELSRDLDNIAAQSYFQETHGKSFLITGGTGFIAYYLVLALLAANDAAHADNTVTILVRSEEKARRKYGALLQRKDLNLLVQDVCRPLNAPEDFHGDYIVHAASSADAKHFENDPIGVFNANVIGTENVMEFAIQSACTSVVYISSFTVYGQGTDKIPLVTEDYNGPESWNMNRSCYPYGKRSAEFICMAYCRKKSVPVKIIRPGFVYGASSLDDPRVYAEIIRDVACHKDIVLKSGGLVYRSMCYVTDLVRAILCTLFYGVDGEAYNVASEHISIRQFAQFATQASSDYPIKLLFEQEKDRNVVLPRDIYGAMSSEKIKSQCFWTPVVAVKEGIAMSARILADQAGKS